MYYLILLHFCMHHSFKTKRKTCKNSVKVLPYDTPGVPHFFRTTPLGGGGAKIKLRDTFVHISSLGPTVPRQMLLTERKLTEKKKLKTKTD